MRYHSCSNCKGERENPKDGYCKKCRAAKVRGYRKDKRMTVTPLTELKRKARHKANMYKRRGILVQRPCKCGDPDTQMHHHDYSKPLEVEWLCHRCHMAEHGMLVHPTSDPALQT
jgi:hypothetical protein